MRICLSEALAGSIGREILDLYPEADLVQLLPDGSFRGDATAIDVFLFSVDLSTDPASVQAAWHLLQTAPLRWVQAPAAGVELPIWGELLQRGVRVTSAAGVHAEPIAQYVITYVLHWHRHVAEHLRHQADHRWEQIVSDDLTSKSIGIVGYGGIGRAVARVARSLGMEVLALRRSEIDDPNVDTAFGPAGLIPLLEQSDYVVLAVPLTDATHHLIGADALRAMRSSAVLINVARGPVVDQAALLTALRERCIRGATLDVVEAEPLPPDSPLWDLDNCIITPHDAGYSPLAGSRLGRLFLRNLERLLNDRPLQNEL